MRLLLLVYLPVLLLVSCDSNEQAEQIKELEQENKALLETIELRERLSYETYYLLGRVAQHGKLINFLERTSRFMKHKDTLLIRDFMGDQLSNTQSILWISNEIMIDNIEILQSNHTTGEYNDCHPQILFFHLIKNQRTNNMTFIAHDNDRPIRMGAKVHLNFIFDSLTINQLEEYSSFVELQSKQNQAYEHYLEINDCDSTHMGYHEDNLHMVYEFQRMKELHERNDSSIRASNNMPLRFDDYMLSHRELFKLREE